MRKNQLGSSELQVSEVGFGCMSLSDDHHANEEILHQAVDGGINYFDTADLYQFGFNEESVGRALKEKRKDIYIATKGGNEWGEGIDGWRWNPSKKYIKNACKNSLDRLQTDYIDLYQLHGGTIDDPLDETIEALEELKKEGLIRYYGTSSIRPNVIKRFSSSSEIVSNMMQFSILDRRPEEWLSLLENADISVIARGPVAKGLLTDSYQKKITSEGYLDYTEDELKQTIHTLKTIASDAGMKLSTLALRYVLDQKTTATAVQGARTKEQLQLNLEASEVPSLSSDIIDAVKQAAKASIYENHRE
ncbi:aldo/keto reductase [Alkalicoccus daliensis]|uniref:Predicted oxidoreductase n=1 Tax=Alkalicoccus daliensis TaxID=745820 RepID=A0A1H0B008_9BACI|nr:aldo/keto reductase [Alkalicoccus daliensis]SDN38978.1 Predicted oxidoreductase [Alkalicoccus daliensis]